MYVSIFLTIFPPLLALASPWPEANVTFVSNTCNETSSTTSTSRNYSSTTTLTVSATFIVTPSSTTASTTTSSGNLTASSGPSATNPVGSGPIRTVASEPFSVAVLRRNATIDLSPMNARSFGFYVGGETASYCPREPCPPGDETVFREQCSMAVVLPGGQQVYAAPNGRIGYTPPHSAFIPLGSRLCPFTYSKQDGDEFGILSTDVWGARGLMACPTADNSTEPGWQVFAAMPNATVPTGNINDCVGFLAITSIYDTVNGEAAAFEYT